MIHLRPLVLIIIWGSENAFELPLLILHRGKWGELLVDKRENSCVLRKE
jgi:hypothetical protein